MKENNKERKKATKQSTKKKEGYSYKPMKPNLYADLNNQRIGAIHMTMNI